MVGHILISPEAIFARRAELDLVASDWQRRRDHRTGDPTCCPRVWKRVSPGSRQPLNQGAMTHDNSIAQGIPRNSTMPPRRLRMQLAEHWPGT